MNSGTVACLALIVVNLIVYSVTQNSAQLIAAGVCLICAILSAIVR